MERILEGKRKHQLVYVLIGFLALQAFVFTLMYINNQNITHEANYDEQNENNDFVEEIIPSEGILPNLTRIDSPLIINNASSPPLWLNLHGRHINNIRVAYYTIDNEWKLVPFQLDEMGYLRTYKYEIGFQAVYNLFSGLSAVDLANWGHFETEHRYIGRNVNDTTSSPYQEMTKYECEGTYWWSRALERGSGYPLARPAQDPREQANGIWDQHVRRIDYDDELVFYARPGKKASLNSWWNYAEYPNRTCITIRDPVDGGQSWMYIYYNSVDMTNPPSINYYIPPGEEDRVSWDKNNLKITGETYDMALDPSNTDLYNNLKIKWPSLSPNDLLTSSNKQYMSVYFHILYDYGLGTLDVNSNAEVWREGQWDEGYYNDQFNAIGYNIAMDFGFGDTGSDWSGHRTYNNHPTGNSPVQEGRCSSSNTHTVVDSNNAMSQVTADSADHDGDTTEITPYVRGWVNFPCGSNEAAIDGPVRVIVDKFTVQVIRVLLGTPVRYEELWTTSSERLKFYANMYQADPMQLDLNMNEPGAAFTIDIYAHFAFMQTDRFSDFVRTDGTAGNSFIALGRAPNGVPGLPSFTQCRTEGKAEWSATYQNSFSQCALLLKPNGNGADDDVVSGGNPTANTYTNTRLVTKSAAPAPNNPLSDWRYLYTSSGGMWSYIPYQEIWQLFTTQTNRDVSTYWKDTADPGGYSEYGIYGNHGNQNGATGSFVRRTIFGNYSYWECLREYARLKYDLNQQLTIANENFPGGPIFEDTSIFVNGQQMIGGSYVKNGDRVSILVDLNRAYLTSEFTVTATNFTNNPITITIFNPSTYIYNISFIVDKSPANPDRVPPFGGYSLRIAVPQTAPIGYDYEELYLDNTIPWAPKTFTAQQPSPSDIQVNLAWSGAKDNNNPNLIDYYEVWRNNQKIYTLDSPAGGWTDSDVLNGQTYTYYIRVYDKVGHYNNSITRQVTINAQFDPAIPLDITPYFRTSVTLDWTANPGNTTVIDNYRVNWASTPSGPYTALSFLPKDTRTAVFTPPSPAHNGTYYLKLESYDSAGGGVSIYSSYVYSLYDTETPIPATISDIPDLYHPTVAQIPVHWSGAFDAFSGIDHYTLWRNDNGGAYSQINGNFLPSQTDYYDTIILNTHIYRYYVVTYDKAGNSMTGPIEYVQYFSDLVGATPNLKISSVIVKEVAQTRGVGFQVNVTVTNIGGLQGSISRMWLKFSHPTYGNVTTQYTIPSPTPALGGNIPPSGGSIKYTFNNVIAINPTAQLGLITVDAAIRGSTNDDTADSTDTIWIRDFSIITINSMAAQSPVETGSNGNWVNMSFTNPMITQVNITSYSIDIQGWVKDTDYWITSVVGPTFTPNGFVLNGGERVDVIFYVQIATGASSGVKNIDGHVVGKELITGTSVNRDSISGTSWNVLVPDTTPPDIKNEVITPLSGDPTPTGTQFTIRCNVSDASGLQSVTAYIHSSTESVIATLPMSAFGGNGTRAFLNSSSIPIGTYHVAITAIDNSPRHNSKTNHPILTFTLVDNTAPTIYNQAISTNNLELGATLVITCNASDFTGISSVTAYIQRPHNSDIQVISMSLFGGGYRAFWTSTGAVLSIDYHVNIRAIDTSPAQNVYTFDDLPFTVRDTTSPDISNDARNPVSGDPTPPGTTFTFSCNVTDLSTIQSVTAYVHNAAHNIIATVPMSVFGGTGYRAFWSSSGTPVGTYHVNITARDSSTIPGSNSHSHDQTFTFTLIDNTAPTVSNEAISPGSGDPTPPGTYFRITCNVSDFSNIFSVKAQIHNEGETVIATITMSPFGGTGYRAFWNSSGYAVGTYHVNITAVDNSAARNRQVRHPILTFTLVDNTAPTVLNEAISLGSGDPTPPGTYFRITCNVSDLTGLFSVKAQIHSASETVIATISMSPFGGTGYRTFWNSSGYAIGTYHVNITAVDSSPARNRQVRHPILIFTLVDNTAPTISGQLIVYPTLELGATQIIRCNVSDFTGIFNVTAYIQIPQNNIIAILLMTPFGGTGYRALWPSTGAIVGNYFVNITAIDSSAARNKRNYGTLTFTVQDTIDPTIQNVNVNPAGGSAGINFTINAQITDLSGIANAWATIENGTWQGGVRLYDDGNLLLHGDLLAGDNVYTNKWLSAGKFADTYNIDINATDNGSPANTASLENQKSITITTIDVTAPTISNVQANPNKVNPGDSVKITAQITDDTGIFTPNVTISNASAWSAVYDLRDDGTNGDSVAGDNIWTYVWSTTGRWVGIYNISVNATDTSPFHHITFALNVTSVNITNIDVKIPSVTNISLLSDQQVGYVYSITCNVTDDRTLDDVIAYIQNSVGTTIATLPMAPFGGTGFRAFFDSTGYAIGLYWLDIKANDTTGNINYTNNADSFTLIDTNGPSITSIVITKPLEYGSTQEIRCNVSDPSGIDSVTVHIEYLGSDVMAVGMSPFGGTGYRAFWDSTDAELGSYDVIIVAIDKSANNNPTTWDPADTFTLRDTIAPLITNALLSTTTNLELGTPQTITCNVTDLHSIYNVSAYIQHPDGTNIEILLMIPYDGTGFIAIWFSYGELGTYYIDIIALDNSFNLRNESNVDVSFELVDTQGPTVENVAAVPDPLQKGSIITITLNASDLSGILEVNASIHYYNGAPIVNLTMSSFGGTGYRAFWTSGAGNLLGLYHIDIVATDTVLNIQIEYTIEIFDLIDTQGPTVENVDASPNPLQKGSMITIKLNASDISGMLDVTADIHYYDGTPVATLPMSIFGGTGYRVFWTSGAGNALGNYHVDIIARDSLSNMQNMLTADTFDIVDTQGPTIENINATLLTLEIGSTIPITCNVSDISGVSSVTLYLQHPHGANIAILPMSSFGGTGYRVFWTSGAGDELGTYEVDIVARDNSPSLNPTTVQDGDQFTLQDTVEPAILSPNVNPLIGEVSQAFTITVIVTDLSPIASVFATITRASNGVWIAGVELFDDGVHSDGSAGDGTYGNIWDSTGYAIGAYNISINATDSSTIPFANTVYENNFESIQLTPAIPQLSVNAFSLTEEGYMGDDYVIVEFTIQVTRADINITAITLRFGATGEYNSYFILVSLNITLPYRLNITDGIIYVKLNYSISTGSPITRNIQPYIALIYKDFYDISYPASINLVTIGSGICIFSIPTITSTNVYSGGTQYLPKENRDTIIFYVYGTHYETYYTTYLDLTSFGLSMVTMTWDATYSRYYYRIPIDLPSNSYDCAGISATINISLPVAGYKEIDASFTGSFIVDADTPIFYSITVPDQFDFDEEEGFKLILNVTDNWTAGFASDIQSVYLSIGDVKLQLSLESSGFWTVMVTPEVISTKACEYGQSFTVGFLEAYDNALNKLTYDLSSYTVKIVDQTKPSIKLDSLEIDGAKGETKFPAGEYLSIRVKINDGQFSTSGLYYVRLYYKISGGNIETSAESDWEYIKLALLDDGYYFGVLSSPGKVGFTADQSVELYLEVSDYAGNVASTKNNAIELTFSQELPIVSYIVLFGSVACLFGAIVYRIGFYHKRAKIIDVDTGTIKHKKH